MKKAVTDHAKVMRGKLSKGRLPGAVKRKMGSLSVAGTKKNAAGNNDRVATTNLTTGRTRHRTFTQEEVIKILLQQKGQVTRAAKVLGCTYRHLKKYIDRNETVKEALADIEDTVLEEVEGALFQNIYKGNVASIIFFLRTRGRKRGYGDNDKVDLAQLAQPVTIVFQPPPEYAGKL